MIPKISNYFLIVMSEINHFQVLLNHISSFDRLIG